MKDVFENYFSEQDFRDIEDGDIDKFMELLLIESYCKHLYEPITLFQTIRTSSKTKENNA